MTQGSAVIVNELGLHLRAAARVVRLTGKARAQVWLGARGALVDGKSLLGITSLMAGPGVELLIRAEGEDEQAVVDSVLELVRQGFAEAQ
jgi:phosphocarrier protein